MKNAFRLTLAVLLTAAFACDPAPKQPQAGGKTAVGVDTLKNVAADDSTATLVQSDSNKVSK